MIGQNPLKYSDAEVLSQVQTLPLENIQCSSHFHSQSWENTVFNPMGMRIVMKKEEVYEELRHEIGNEDWDEDV